MIKNETKNTTKEEKPSLKRDIYFKAFFSKEGNEKYLKDFLNAILNIEIYYLKVREEVNLEQLSPKEKGGRLDLQAVLNDGMIVNIEMQMENEHNIEQRNDIYEAKTISRHFPRGGRYEDAKPLISIYILNYNIFDFEDYISNTIKVIENHTEQKIKSIMKEYYIELPKYRKAEVDMNNKLNQWLAFIDGEDRGRIAMAKEKNKIIKEAERPWKYLTGDEATQRLEELRDMWASDRASAIAYAERQARAEGRTEGQADGKIEKQKEIAKNMLDKGMAVDLIIELTGLSKEEVKKLKNDTSE